MLPENNTPSPSTQTNNNPSSLTVQPALRISDFVIVIVSHWYWILLCLALSYGIAEYIILKSRPIYTRSASILIKDINRGSGAAIQGFGAAGLFAQSTDLNNEVFMLKSPATMTDVIKRLDLQMDYEMEGTFHRSTLYGNSLPFTASISQFPDQEDCSFAVSFIADSTIELSAFVRTGHSLDGKAVRGKLCQPINTPLGDVVITPTNAFFEFEHLILVNHVRLQSTLSKYSNELSVKAEEASSIINLNIDDHSIQRAEEILYTLIAIYNERWMDDRNQVSVSTNEFISERIKVIESELGNVENQVTDFKSTHLLVGDVESQAGYYQGQAQAAQTQLVDLNNQLYLARSVRGYLTNEQNFYQLLPSSQGMSNASISGQINEYNTILMRRNNLLSASSLQNPIVQDLDNQLAALRGILIGSIDNHISEINMYIRSAQSQQAIGNSRVAASPKQGSQLLSIERQQKVKEELYLYLLQKREENELSQAFTAYNSRVVTPPSGPNDPTSPVTKSIYVMCLLVGLLLPVAILILGELANTSVRGRKDLDGLNIPFLGELPQFEAEPKMKRFIKQLRNRWFPGSNGVSRHRKEDKTLHLVVKPDSTNVMNEAFRVARTNLEFVAGRNDQGARVIMLTSFNPNSGKTFVVSNLGLALTYKKKRILVIDLDMRKRSLSALVGKHSVGLSNYLGGYVDDYHEIIKPVPEVPELDVLPAGKIPPNPTELLYEPRLDDLLQSVRKEYDYIFLDCPPLEIVADATIVSRLADATIFVIRAEALQRTALPDVQKYYDENRLPKMTILLNGTTDAFSRYGYHRYGSRYGYSYGYGRAYSYGYGYGYGQDSEAESESSTKSESKK